MADECDGAEPPLAEALVDATAIEPTRAWAGVSSKWPGSPA